MSHEGNDFLRENEMEKREESVVTHTFEDHDRFTVTGEQVDLVRIVEIVEQIQKGGYLSGTEKEFVIELIKDKYPITWTGLIRDLTL